MRVAAFDSHEEVKIMATSSFDVSFRIRTEADAKVFIEALEESLSNPQIEQPCAKRHEGDPVETKRRILARYAKPNPGV